jgi:hypothetical protein
MMTLWKKMRRERGSALLISLMVIVGLSMLGLGFVALSETEAAISTNQRNREEALTHAEAAANVVVDWFQNPKWALSKGLMPSNDPSINTELSTMKLVRTNNIGNAKYRPVSAAMLFDLPFKPGFDDRFWGTPNSPDILISRTTAPKFLKAFNGFLFTDTLEGGEITEIRIWAPPVVGGSLTGGYYNDGGDRYGVATVRVTAQRFNTNDTLKTNPIATRTVQLVVTEFPFPGPNGPIQSNSAIFTQGSFSVYWGEVSSTKPLDLVGKETVPGMPWATAWDLVEFEHGYDTTWSWQPGTAYAAGDVVHASVAMINVDANLKDWAFECTTAGNSDALAANEPAWESAVAGTTTFTEASGLAWKRVAPRNWPMFKTDTSQNTDVHNWLYQMIGQTYIDPWAQARTRAYFTDEDPTKNATPAVSYTGAAPYNAAPAGLYSNPNVDPTSQNQPFYSWFQYQTKDLTPYYKIVAFPHIDYDFWKQMALAGDGQGSVFYFAYNNTAGSTGFYRLTDASVVKDPDVWANSCTGVSGALGPGFYFFDTIGGKNPQNNVNAASMLTPTVKVNGGNPCVCMKGFIYLNTTTFSSKGAKGEQDKFYAFPGEPYRDVGFHEVITDSTDPNYLKFKTDSISGRIAKPHNPNHGKWDYQEINDNGVFDLYLTDVTKGGTLTVKKPDGTNLPSPTYVPVEYYEGCTVPNSVTGTAGNCSEPHEAYLNMIYPADSSITYAAEAPYITGNVSSYSGSKVKIGWEAPSSQTRLAKTATDKSMTAVTNCSTDQANCTSNSHDDTGPLTKLQQKGPILEGVLYVEGDYDSEGNATYYGSVLVQGNCCGAGTPSVYFDESLVTGDFKSKFPDFPRVYISSYTTENQ